MAMYSLSAVLKTCVVCIAFFTQVSEQVKCPQHKNNPGDVNTRIMKLANQKTYFPKDKEYEYKITICQEDDGNNVAISQFGKNWDKSKREWVTVGRYENAVVRGGTDWVMITYPNGKEYHSHCGGVRRQGVLTITCDPGVTRGEVKIIEEFRTNGTQPSKECYYLFELNHEAACTVTPKHLSAGSILLIILLVVGAVYIIISILYQRFVVRAKGMEQIPNYNSWVNCGSLQADGCNFNCRCAESQPTRYKTMDDVLADDDKDDALLPV